MFASKSEESSDAEDVGSVLPGKGPVFRGGHDTHVIPMSKESISVACRTSSDGYIKTSPSKSIASMSEPDAEKASPAKSLASEPEPDCEQMPPVKSRASIPEPDAEATLTGDFTPKASLLQPTSVTASVQGMQSLKGPRRVGFYGRSARGSLVAQEQPKADEDASEPEASELEELPESLPAQESPEAGAEAQGDNWLSWIVNSLSLKNQNEEEGLPGPHETTKSAAGLSADSTQGGFTTDSAADKPEVEEIVAEPEDLQANLPVASAEEKAQGGWLSWLTDSAQVEPTQEEHEKVAEDANAKAAATVQALKVSDMVALFEAKRSKRQDLKHSVPDTDACSKPASSSLAERLLDGATCDADPYAGGSSQIDICDGSERVPTAPEKLDDRKLSVEPGAPPAPAGHETSKVLAQEDCGTFLAEPAEINIDLDETAQILEEAIAAAEEAEAEFRAASGLSEFPASTSHKPQVDVEQGLRSMDDGSAKVSGSGLSEPLLGGAPKDSAPSASSRSAKHILLGLCLLLLIWFCYSMSGAIGTQGHVVVEKDTASKVVDKKASEGEAWAAARAAAKQAAAEKVAQEKAAAREREAEAAAAEKAAAEKAAAEKAAAEKVAAEKAAGVEAAKAAAQRAAAEKAIVEQAAAARAAAEKAATNKASTAKTSAEDEAAKTSADSSDVSVILVIACLALLFYAMGLRCSTP